MDETLLMIPGPVSYTHLDVYKRQLMDGLKNKAQDRSNRKVLMETASVQYAPVSYTHLDVYKRQTRTLSQRASPSPSHSGKTWSMTSQSFLSNSFFNPKAK